MVPKGLALWKRGKSHYKRGMKKASGGVRHSTASAAGRVWGGVDSTPLYIPLIMGMADPA